MLEVDEAWAGHEVACLLCEGGFVLPPTAAAPGPPVPQPPLPSDPSLPSAPKINHQLKAWKRQRRIRRVLFALALLGLLGGAGWGFNQWRGERPPVEAMRELAHRALEWASNLIKPPTAPVAPAPTPTPTPEATPEPSPEPEPEAADPVAWLIENPDRRPASLTLQEDATFPVIYEGRLAGKVKIDKGKEVALVRLDAETVEVRYREGSLRLPHEATNLREVAAGEMAKSAPTPPPAPAPTGAPSATPAAAIPEGRAD